MPVNCQKKQMPLTVKLSMYIFYLKSTPLLFLLWFFSSNTIRIRYIIDYRYCGVVIICLTFWPILHSRGSIYLPVKSGTVSKFFSVFGFWGKLSALCWFSWQSVAVIRTPLAPILPHALQVSLRIVLPKLHHNQHLLLVLCDILLTLYVYTCLKSKVFVFSFSVICLIGINGNFDNQV